jgi:hypothetical protein
VIDKSTELIAVNPPRADDEVRLTRADVWRGLMWKAEVPMPFVEPIVDCAILERFEDGFLREIQHLTPSGETEPIQERILLDPQNTVTFIRISGSAPGRIINEIVEQDGELYLRFHFLLGIEGMTHRSPEELEYERGFAQGYLSAVDTTLEAIREFVRTGVDPTAFAQNHA